MKNAFFTRCSDALSPFAAIVTIRPLWFENPPRPLQSLTTDRIEDHVQFADLLLKWRCMIVDYLFRAQARHKVEVARRSSRDHVRPTEPGELYRKEPHSSGAPMYQDALSSLEHGTVVQPLPCRQRADRNGSGFDMSQPGRLGRHRGERRGATLGHGSIGEPVVQAEDLLADFETPHVLADILDHARELVTRDGPDALLARLSVRGRIPKQLGRSYAGRAYTDQ